MTKTFATLATLFILLQMSLRAETSLYEIPLVDIEGKETSLAPYESKVMLIVNVASKCGFTRQYAGLEELNTKYRDKGVVVLGFPCNQFKGQEPGTEAEIAEFCRLNYGVSFPLYSKIEVNGPNRHPLYEKLAGEASPFPGDITWNFNKFLVGKNGQILARYPSKVEPLSEQLVADVENALAES